jgi:excisionase family DNA binding protein
MCPCPDCPAARESRRSLLTHAGEDGRVKLSCPNCSTSEILRALGLTEADLTPQDDADASAAERGPFRLSQALQLYTIEEACVILRVTVSMLMYHRKRGQLPFVKVGRLLRIRGSDLEKFIRDVQPREKLSETAGNDGEGSEESEA